MSTIIMSLLVFDFLVIGAFSLLSPIYAIFVTQKIAGGTAAVVGFALAIYWIVKSILQLPIARYLDKNHGEKDDLWAMILGTLLAAGIMASYVFAKDVWHVYLLQFLWGAADALTTPPWYAIFTRHIDKGKEGYEWALRSSVSFGGGSAIGGAVGGVLAVAFGFELVFLIIAFVTFVSTIVLFSLRRHVLPRVPKQGFPGAMRVR